MGKEVSVLGLLPARGGSKGIVGKNTRNLIDRPLLAWAAVALSKAEKVNYRLCSTDCEKIGEVAKMWGLEVPWLRPKSLARDESLIIDVILHALDELEKGKDAKIFTHVALVQATSPTVLASDIDECISLAIESDADTVLTAVESGQKHPTTMFRANSRKEVSWLTNKEERMSRRQELTTVYCRTGLVYVLKVESLRANKSIYGEKTYFVEIPEARALTIDNEVEFKIAEVLLDG